MAPTAKFCAECAHPVEVVTRETPSPDSYTPRHLAAKILTSKIGLEGERKTVTVLFADLKGSMELLAHRDAEEARTILDPVLELMMDAVHRYEGTVNQVMGDGIMALFGAPLAHEDHALRACYAALRMQESAKRHADASRRTDIRVRIGLNSGEVVVRAIGSDLHMDYTAVGETTHLAARMEQLAEPGTILLAPATRRLVEDYVEVDSRGVVSIKGLSEPMEVYQLVGASSVGSRLQATAARGLTQFVGRRAEMEQLQVALKDAGAGRGQIVAVVGDAGIGKSRLYWEFVHSDRTDGWQAVESRSVSYGKATSYLPVVGLLKRLFDIEPRDQPQEVREKVVDKVMSLGEALRPTLPCLLSLLDLPVEDATWQALEPPQRRHRTIDAVKRLLLRQSQIKPLIVIYEDLHWIDSETQAVLDALVDSLPAARMLLLVNYRPEYQHGWVSKTYYRQLRIDPLAPSSAEELLDALLGADAALAPLKRLLIQRTEANPFFLEESVRTLVETKALVGERGAYRLVLMPDALSIPATAQAMIAARIDRLTPEEKQLLQIAAVIGKDIPYALLQGIVSESEDALHRVLDRLQSAEFLYEARLFPDLEYTFKHALTHEVAYGSLLQKPRRLIHARIVEAIERLFPERLAEHVEALGRHAARGEEWGKAVQYLRQAGTKAAGRSANREAAQWFEEAISALTHLPESREAMVQGIDLRIDLRNSLVPLGELSRALAFLREAEILADKINDPRRQSALSTMRALARFAQGDFEGALASARRGQAIAAGEGDHFLEAAVSCNVALSNWALGNYRAAITVLRRNMTYLQGDHRVASFGTIAPAVMSCWLLAVCHTELGEFDEGLARGEEGVRIAETIDQAGSLASANWGIGYLYCRKGQINKGIASLERVVSVSRERNIALWYRLGAPLLGYAYAQAGRLSEALPLLAPGVNTNLGEGMTLVTLARVAHAYVLASQEEEAKDLTRRVLDVARKQKARGFEAEALWLHGEIAARRQPADWENRDASHWAALSLAEELGMRPLVAHCHAGLAKLYRSTENSQQRNEHFATATTMYREMGMTYWLEKLEPEPGPRW